MFSPELRAGVATGDITVSIRLWQRPKVKVGGRYTHHGFSIEVDAMELLPYSAVTDEDLARSGEPDRETLRRRTAHAGPVDDGTLVYRVEFHTVELPDYPEEIAAAGAEQVVDALLASDGGRRTS